LSYSGIAPTEVVLVTGIANAGESPHACTVGSNPFSRRIASYLPADIALWHSDLTVSDRFNAERSQRQPADSTYFNLRGCQVLHFDDRTMDRITLHTESVSRRLRNE
jgi:hypothetical protein